MSNLNFVTTNPSISKILKKNVSVIPTQKEILHKLLPIEADSGNKSFIVTTKITTMNKSAMLKCLLLTCIERLLK